jgi:Pyruvate/2-oxoacid:ferredoxin oxidoreductase delta subunit
MECQPQKNSKTGALIRQKKEKDHEKEEVCDLCWGYCRKGCVGDGPQFVAG